MAVGNEKTHYEVLQVARNAVPAVVRASYKVLIQQCHPDRFSPADEAHRLTQELNAAYAVLSDSDLRAEYDALLARQRAQHQPPAAPEPTAPPNNIARPWMRFWARKLDVMAFSLAAAIVLWIAAIVLEIMAGETLSSVEPWFLGLLIVLAWVLALPTLEAALLSLTGTTPGKWLLRVRLQSGDRADILFMDAFERSIRVWWRGLGAGVPVLTHITMLMGYTALKGDGVTTWDRDGNFTVTHGRVGPLRAATAVVCFATLFFIFAVLSVVVESVISSGDYQAGANEAPASETAMPNFFDQFDAERSTGAAQDRAALPASDLNNPFESPPTETWEQVQGRFFAIPANQAIRADATQFSAWEAAMQEIVNEAARDGRVLSDWDLLQEAGDRVVRLMQAKQAAPVAAPVSPPQQSRQTPWTSAPEPAQVTTESSGAASARRLEEQRAARSGAADSFPSWEQMKALDAEASR